MSVPARFPNATPAPAEGGQPKTRSFTAGFSDWLGDRQLVFDPQAGSSLEILRFKPEFGDAPGFEEALRARVDQVSHAQHSSLATIHGVERSESGLSLITRHVSGRRVSELLPKAHGPAFALELIKLVTPALVALHRSADGVAHGALSAERIVVTRDGRLVVVEHVLGSALESLKLSRQRIHELGLPVLSANDPVRCDPRSDVMQLGFVALSLLLGRKLDPADCPAKVPVLLDEYAHASGSPMLVGKMRAWLEKALQSSTRSFASARDAQDAFGDLPDDVDVRIAETTRGVLPFPIDTPATGTPVPAPAASSTPRLQPVPPASTPAPMPARSAAVESPKLTKPASSGRSRWLMWAMGGLALLAVGEGAALFVLPYLRADSPTIEVKSPGPVAPVTTPSAATLHSPSPTPTSTPAQTPAPDSAAYAVAKVGAALAQDRTTPAPDGATQSAPPPAAGPRFGGMTVASPIELQVFEQGKLVGSTSGPIAINEGPHSLDFVNETLGFRFQRSVTVKNGQMTTVNIGVPNGRLSINAVPWAEVTIDGTAHGETPLANLSLPIGSHEVVFKHPELGERKQTVIVKVDGLLRVTESFKQDKR